MKINDEEVKLIITPLAIRKTEENDSQFDILGLLRNIEEKVEPRLTDYYKLIYAGYLGAKPEEEITFDEFLKLVEDIDIIEINHVGIELLLQRKN